MSEHGEIRELLSLAAAGDLDVAEERRVQAHVAGCEACAAELERWRGVVGDLRRLPTPQPSPGLVARVRVLAEAELVTESEQRSQQVNMVFLLLFAWALTLSGWVVLRVVSGGMLAWLDLFGGRLWVWMAGYALLGWLGSSFAAVILMGWKQRSARRMA